MRLTEKAVEVMRDVAKFIRRLALTVTALFAGFGILFASGYIFEDPGGWAAALIFAAMVVPLVGLTVAAVRKPEPTLQVVTAGVALVIVYGVIGLFVDLIEGPDLPLVALVLSVPIAVIGQRQAKRAGELLLVLAAVPFALLLIQRVVREDGAPLDAALGGSSGVIVIPLAVFGALFLLAWAIERSAPAPPATSHPRHARL